MHVLIGGGSGFIGSALTQALRARGDSVTWVSRTPGKNRITWEDVSNRNIPDVDAVVNLAGRHILDLRKRWNNEYRDDVIKSRVKTTEELVRALNETKRPPRVFVSTAGKCFYGTCELGAVTNYPELSEESEPMGMDFPAELVSLWEKAAEGIDSDRIRHVKVRIGIAIGKVERKSLISKFWRIGRSRGLLPIIRLPFCLGIGATIGHGHQPFPWIHIDDMVGILLHVIDRQDLSGKFNAVSPGIQSNSDFIRAFARHLHRPVLWSIPRWLIKFIVGTERASILLEGQHVVPKRTLESGYTFKFPDIDSALDDLVQITI